MNKKWFPFIKAILRPDLEEVSGLNDLTTKELVEVVKNFSDEDILGLAMKNPDPKKGYGFILNPRAFDILQDKGQRLATIMHALLSRFGEAQKNTSDWQKYVCQFRKTTE